MDQSNKEEFWNSLTHFTGIILTLIGVPFLITQNSDLTKIELFSLLFFSLDCFSCILPLLFIIMFKILELKKF